MPAIVRWSSSASPIPRVGSSWRRRRRKLRLVELGGQDVGPEAGQPLVEARARLGHQLEHRTAELDGVLPVAADHEPGRRRRRAGRAHPPRARHAQVRVDHQVALEADEQVLAVGVDRPHDPPAQPLGPAVAAEPRVRRGDLVRHLVLKDGSDAIRQVVDRVAFRHPLRVRAARADHTGDESRGWRACPCSGGSPPWAWSSWPRSGSRSGSCSSTRSSSARRSRPSSNARVIAQVGRPDPAPARRPALPEHARAAQ